MADEHVFLISQIGDEGSTARRRADEVHDFIVAPVAQSVGLDVRRSDRESAPGLITNQIVRLIVDARFIVADITGRNPNVFYELGVAHSFRKPVIILVDQATTLPFDTHNERAIVIGDNGEVIGASQANQARASLQESAAAVMAEGFVVENVVTAAAMAQSLSSLAQNDPIAATLAQIGEFIEEWRESRRSPNVGLPFLRPLDFATWDPATASSYDFNAHEAIVSLKSLPRAILAACEMRRTGSRELTIIAPNPAHAEKVEKHLPAVWEAARHQMPNIDTIVVFDATENLLRASLRI